jgi:CheY-like chemotaxis protein
MKNNSPKSILLVEDENVEILFLYQILKFYANLTIYENPKEALNNSNLDSFDLIITDVKMPYISGYDFIKILRERNINTPIIVASAYALSGEKEKAHSAGASDFISKPIRVDKLQELVIKYLNININNLDSQISERLKLINEFSISNYSIKNSLNGLISAKNIFQGDNPYITNEISKTIEEFQLFKNKYLALKNEFEEDYKIIFRELYYCILSTENIIDKYLQHN